MVGLLAVLGGRTSRRLQHSRGQQRAGRPPPDAALVQARNDVRTMANKTLQRLYAEQPKAKQAVEGAAGYAVFSTFGMKILDAGGGTGKGLAVNNATGKETYMRMAEVQAGLGMGVDKSSPVWVFEMQSAFNRFVDSGYEFGGQATLAAKASRHGGGFIGAAAVSPVFPE